MVRTRWGLVTTAGVLVALIATGLTALSAGDAYFAYGLPDPGALTHYG